VKFPSKQTNTATGAYLLPRAVKLARDAYQIGVPSKSEVFDGFLLRGTNIGSLLKAQVLDLPATVLFPDTTDRSVGDARQIDGRDYYNSALAVPDHAAFLSAEQRSNAVYILANVGFPQRVTDQSTPQEEQEYTKWITSVPWSYLRAYEDDHLFVSHMSQWHPTGIYADRGFDCVESQTTVYCGARAYRDGGVPFVFKDTALAELADGYLPVVKSSYLYVSHEYQGFPTFARRVTTSGQYGSLLVIPMVKRGATPEVLDWGDAALLFLVVDLFEGNLRVLHNQLWKPDQHSVDFFHQGPLASKPINGFTTSPLAAAQTALDAWWGSWTTGPSGKRPCWFDAITGTQVGDTIEVSARLCASNGDYLVSAPPVPDPDYWIGSGHATLRFALSPAGADVFTLSVDERGYEIYESPTAYATPYASSPYTRWVVGHLDTTKVVNRFTATMRQVGASVVEVDLKVEGPRNGPTANLCGYTPGSEAFVFTVRTPGSPDAVYTVPFTALGAGIQMPVGTYGLGTDKYLAAPGASYKLWCMDQLFVPISSTELAFIASTYFDDGDDASVVRPCRLCVFDTTTGAVTIRSALPSPASGFSKEYRITHRRAPSLSCIQRTVPAAVGVAYEAVLLFTAPDGFGEIYISRDSGQTWQVYITEAPTLNGAFYLGNPLTSNIAPGKLISGG
jgi:hypothetical protein